MECTKNIEQQQNYETCALPACKTVLFSDCWRNLLLHTSLCNTTCICTPTAESQ